LINREGKEDSMSYGVEKIIWRGSIFFLYFAV